MIKGQEWNLNDPRWADGSVRLGSGSTFHGGCALPVKTCFC